MEVTFNASIKSVGNRLLSSGDNATRILLEVSPENFAQVPTINAMSLLAENKQAQIKVTLSV